MRIIGVLSREAEPRVLASESYVPDPSGYMTVGMNKALAYIRENLTQPFNEQRPGRDRRTVDGRLLSLLPQAYRHVAASVHPAPAHQHGLPDPDERRTGAGLGHMLRGRVQQPFQLQPAVSRREGHAALTVQKATGRQFLGRTSRMAGRIRQGVQRRHQRKYRSGATRPPTGAFVSRSLWAAEPWPLRRRGPPPLRNRSVDGSSDGRSMKSP